MLCIIAVQILLFMVVTFQVMVKKSPSNVKLVSLKTMIIPIISVTSFPRTKNKIILKFKPILDLYRCFIFPPCHLCIFSFINAKTKKYTELQKKILLII